MKKKNIRKSSKNFTYTLDLTGLRKDESLRVISAQISRARDYLAYLEWLLKAREMPYESYLSTSHWRTTRRVALNFYGYQCLDCKATSNLEVHHKTYARLGEETVEDLEVLCRDCHQKQHEDYLDIRFKQLTADEPLTVAEEVYIKRIAKPLIPKVRLIKKNKSQ